MLLKTLFVIIILFTDGTFARTLEPAVNDKDGHAGRYKRDTTDEGVLSQLGIKRFVSIYNKVEKNLGMGQSGSVDLVSLPEKVAVKKIHQKQLAENELARDFLKNEIEAYKACNSPFVVKMYDVFEDESDVHIVLESVENGSLVKLLEAKSGQAAHGIAEDFARFYVAQAFLALNHLHSKGYTHNDAWIENFLLDKQGFLKLIDFGLAFKLEDFKDPSKRREYIGIENSMPFRGWYYNRAPERIKLEEYGPSSDYWALGLLAYRLVFGKEAFNEIPAKKSESKEQKTGRWKQEETMIVHGSYEMPESPKVSESLKDFIQSLLVIDPKHRLGHANPEDIKKHKWFTSVNFDWNALERKDANHFRKFLLQPQSTSEHIKAFIKKIARKVSDSVDRRRASVPLKNDRS